MDGRNFCKELVSVSILLAFEQDADKWSDETTARFAMHPINTDIETDDAIYKLEELGVRGL